MTACIYCNNPSVDEIISGLFRCDKCKSRFEVHKPKEKPEADIPLATIKYTVRDYLTKFELLWLHKNSNLLYELISLKLKKGISYETVTRCRRKLFEEGNMPFDKEILAKYIHTSGKQEEKHKEYFKK